MAELFLDDIQVPMPNEALGKILAEGPGLRVRLLGLVTQIGTAYSGKVAKKTGQLAASPRSEVVEAGGHDHDRMVGKVTVGGELAVAAKPWRGAPFYYGVLHNFGSPAKEAQFPAHNDLREVAKAMFG